jgi:hypothetical protein
MGPPIYLLEPEPGADLKIGDYVFRARRAQGGGT